MTAKKTSAAIAALTSLTLSFGTAAIASDYREETTNLIAFAMVDFVGWNNADMDVMRKYHGADVAVDMAGIHTDGIDPHVEMLEQALASGVDERIIQHSPKLAEGEWTAVVGKMAASTMATVAQWKDGVMVAEYLFLRPMTAEEIQALDTSDPTVRVTTPDDKDLRAATGAVPGWSAVMGKDYALFTHTEDGKVVEQLGFAVQ